MRPTFAAIRISGLLPGLWLAPDLAAQATATGSETGALDAGYFAQLLGGLVVVLAAILILAWALKRLNRLPGVNQRKMEITGTLSLGQRERLVSVRSGELELLLGVTAGSISTLHVIDDAAGQAAKHKTRSGTDGDSLK